NELTWRCMMISTIARLYQVLTSRTKVLIVVSGMVFLAFALARGQSPANTNEPAPVPIGYSTLQHITSNDSGAVIEEKAAKVLPRPNQTSWMRLERTFFIHLAPIRFGELNGAVATKTRLYSTPRRSTRNSGCARSKAPAARWRSSSAST